MKNFYPVLLGLLLFSCSDEHEQEKIDSMKTDSALKAQMTITVPRDSVSKDTVHMVALPPVFEGDIVMHNSDDPKLVEFGGICGSKYNHCGIIFYPPARSFIHGGRSKRQCEINAAHGMGGSRRG